MLFDCNAIFIRFKRNLPCLFVTMINKKLKFFILFFVLLLLCTIWSRFLLLHLVDCTNSVYYKTNLHPWLRFRQNRGKRDQQKKIYRTKSIRARFMHVSIPIYVYCIFLIEFFFHIFNLCNANGIAFFFGNGVSHQWKVISKMKFLA